MNRLRPALVRIAQTKWSSSPTTLQSKSTTLLRSFTTPSLDNSVSENFVPSPPTKLTVEMAEGIADATQFYVRHGVAKQRLESLSKQTDLPAVVKWQKMMEVFLTTQVHVIAGLGYSTDEQGLTKYAQDLAQCLQEADDTMRDLLTELRRDTWRELVSTAFELQLDQMKSLSIVDARNLMHKVSSKMVDPDVLAEIQARCAELPTTMESNPELALAEKHRVVRAEWTTILLSDPVFTIHLAKYLTFACDSFNTSSCITSTWLVVLPLWKKLVLEKARKATRVCSVP